MKRQMTMTEVRAIAYVVAHMERQMPGWAYNALNQMIFEVEDELFTTPAPSKEVAVWKMERLGEIAHGCAMTPGMVGWYTLLQRDIKRHLSQPNMHEVA